MENALYKYPFIIIIISSSSSSSTLGTYHRWARRSFIGEHVYKIQKVKLKYIIDLTDINTRLDYKIKNKNKTIILKVDNKINYVNYLMQRLQQQLTLVVRLILFSKDLKILRDDTPLTCILSGNLFLKRKVM